MRSRQRQQLLAQRLAPEIPARLTPENPNACGPRPRSSSKSVSACDLSTPNAPEHVFAPYSDLNHNGFAQREW
jgi:hypothetical protein